MVGVREELDNLVRLRHDIADGPSISLSVVVPCYNEDAGIDELYRRVSTACEQYGETYEIVVNGNGDWTPGHILDGTGVIIPISLEIHGTFTDADGETFPVDEATAKGAKAGQGKDPCVPAVLEPRHREARREDEDPGHQLAGQLLDQPAQFRVDEPAVPGTRLVLDDLRPVQDQGPALAPQPAEEVIDAEAGGQVGRAGQAGTLPGQRWRR